MKMYLIKLFKIEYIINKPIAQKNGESRVPEKLDKFELQHQPQMAKHFESAMDVSVAEKHAEPVSDLHKYSSI